MTPFFYKGPNFCTKFDPLNDFSIRRSLYHLKAEECKNLQAFEYFQFLNKNMLNGTIKIGFFIDIRWRCLKIFITLNSANLLIFKFRNSEFYLKDNFVNN